MPANKDFKRVVRARMRHTGESYTAARAALLQTIPDHSPAVVTPAPDLARLAGISESAVTAATGCSWDKWVFALDRAGARRWPHGMIATHVREKYHTTPWWTQMVTVGYERIRGLRAIGQKRSGACEVSRSRTLPVPLARLYRAFRDGRQRERWLPGVALTVRSATPHKVVRIDWPDGTRLEATFAARRAGQSSVQLQHGLFADKAAADRARAFWGERLDALARELTVERPPRVRQAVLPRKP